MDELLDVIDENGNELGLAKEKSKIHKDGDWHKGSHIWIIRGNKILLQKRVFFKKFFPNRYDVACAGHVKSGENYEDAILRELKEELGIDAAKDQLIFLEKRKQVSIDRKNDLISREINYIYLLKLNDTSRIKLQQEEVAEVRLFDIDELRLLLKNKSELFVDDLGYFSEIIDRIEKFLNL